MVAERILVLTRNVLQVPADPAEQRPDSDANIHDQVRKPGYSSEKNSPLNMKGNILLLLVQKLIFSLFIQ